MRGIKSFIVVCVLSAMFAEVAEARGRFFGRSRCVSCQPRGARRFNNFNANAGVGACRQLNRIDNSAHLKECVDSSGRRSIVQVVQGIPTDGSSTGSLANNPNLEAVRNPFTGEVQFIRRLFIGGDGLVRDRFGVPIQQYPNGDQVVAGLRNVYQPTFGRFRNGSRAQRLVTQFLAANNGVLRPDGNYTIDLDSMPIPSEFKNSSLEEQRRIKLKALNYALNTANTNCDVKFEDRDIDQASGTVALNYFGRAGSGGQTSLEQCLGPANQLLFETADATLGCTGRIRGANLLAKLGDVNVYYDTINAPRTKQELEAIVGIRDGLNTAEFDGSPNNLYVTEPEPTADEHSRILKPRKKRGGAAPGQYCFTSFDFDVKVEGAAADARNVLKNGVNVVHDAEEWLCIGRNGFMQGYIYNEKGQLLPEAPASIAHGGIVWDGTIAPPTACMDCHAGGFRGGVFKENGKDLYTDNSGKVQPGFMSNVQYDAIAKASTNVFLSAVDRHNAMVLWPAVDEKGKAIEKAGKPYPTLPKFRVAYDQQISKNDIAKVSLGLLNSGIVPGDKTEITRNDFEAYMRESCNVDKLARVDGFNSQFFQQNGGGVRGQIRHSGGGCANGVCN